VLGLSPLEAGLWTLPWALSFVVGSQLTPRLARRIPPAALMAGGFVLAAAGFALFLTLDASSGFWTFFLGSVIFSLGLAPVFTLAIDLIVGVAPAERARGLGDRRDRGGVRGRGRDRDLREHRRSLLPGRDRRQHARGRPAGGGRGGRDTLAGAVEVAQGLPERIGARLLDAASTAFLEGIHVSAAISVVGSIVLALFVWLRLRPEGIGAEPVIEEDEDLDDVA
jgi:DHA2 family multidrug resistance protein-like MFS transporter